MNATDTHANGCAFCAGVGRIGMHLLGQRIGLDAAPVPFDCSRPGNIKLEQYPNTRNWRRDLYRKPLAWPGSPLRLFGNK